MCADHWSLSAVFVVGAVAGSQAQSLTMDLVYKAVDAELRAAQADHSHWLYFDVDTKPGDDRRQWTAETGNGTLQRVQQAFGGRYVSR